MTGWRFTVINCDARGVVTSPWNGKRLARFLTPEQAKVEAKLRNDRAA